MTKQDFIALADTLRGMKIPMPILDALMEFCAKQNPRFDRERWIAYWLGTAGPNGGRKK